jgi:hypothetical protein
MSFMNLAAWDRVLRVALGIVMLWAGWFGHVHDVWAVALRIFAWVPLITGLIGWCPFYAMLGTSSRKRR